MATTRRGDGLHERGFTLIEVLGVMAVTAVLLTVGALALRNYWFTHALHGARDEAMTHLRAQQERVVSESHPLVYGARFRPGSSSWALIQFDPTTNVCAQNKAMKFDTGVQVASAAFNEAGTMGPIVDECRTDLGVPSSDKFVMFFARGTASSGSLTLTQPAVNKTLSMSVTAITGRVESS